MWALIQDLLVWTGERYVPWEQIGNAVDGVIGDLGEDVLEIDLGIEAVELGRAEQGVDGGGAFTACVRATKEKILPSKRDDAQRTFGGVVVDLESAVVGIARQGAPSRERIADRRRRIGLAGELGGAVSIQRRRVSVWSGPVLVGGGVSMNGVGI